METVRVVIADDNLQLQSMIAEYLRQQSGIEVVGAASNGVDTVRLVQEEAPDVLVCDMIMPQMDGYGVLEEIARMRLPKRPGVIALTALGRDDFITRAINLGACYYMVKPFDFSVLAQRVFEAAGELVRADAIGVRIRKEAHEGEGNLEERIANRFLTVGIPAHIK